MKIKRKKRGTDVNREFVAPLSTRIGTEDGGMRFIWISIFPFTWLECNFRDPIKSRFLPTPVSLSLSLFQRLSPLTVLLFRNSESRNFGNGLSRGNPKKRERRWKDPIVENSSNPSSFRLRRVLLFLHPATLALIARRKKAHSCWQTAIYDVS